MSEAGAADTAVTAATAGQRLRQAREATGLHVVALAAMLKVPVRKLEALEADRYDDLPDKTFVRALALSVCRQLKVDATPILALLPQTEQVRLGEAPSLNTPFRSPDVTLAQKSTGLSVPRPALFAGAVLLLAAVVWFAVPERPAPVAGPATEVAPSGAVVVAEPVSPATPATDSVPPVAAAAGSAPSVTIAPAEPAADAAPAPASTAAAPAPVAPVATGDALLQIRVSAVSWVEVVGASGNLLIQRELRAGETVGFSSDAPYKVVVGHADGTQVSVRGKPLDITGFARNNVARFEVK